MLPDQWSKLRFMVVWKGARLQVSLDKEKMEVENFSEVSCKFFVFGRPHKVVGGKKKIIQLTD
jgi:trehalose/maltose hydrolase-like predicted phosphorylase